MDKSEQVVFTKPPSPDDLEDGEERTVFLYAHQVEPNDPPESQTRRYYKVDGHLFFHVVKEVVR